MPEQNNDSAGAGQHEDFTEQELDGIKQTTENAGEAVVHAVRGDWDAAGDSLLSMTESALGVVTGGVSKAVEDGLDKPAQDLGFGSTHDAINAGLHAAGNALGDGLSDLVGTEQSAQSLASFDQGDILGGIGHMAEGAGDTIGSAVGHGLSDAGDALGDLLGGGGGTPNEPDAGAQPADQSDGPAMAGQMPEDGGS
jgi:hypothetical protein